MTKVDNLKIRLLLAASLALCAASLAGCQPPGYSESAADTTPAATPAAAPEGLSVPLGELPRIKLSYEEQHANGHVGETLSFRIGITNGTSQALSPGPVKVRASWHDPKAFSQIGASQDFPLTAPVEANGQASLAYSIQNPAQPGPYLLKISLVDAKGTPLETAGVAPLHYNVSID